MRKNCDLFVDGWKDSNKHASQHEQHSGTAIAEMQDKGRRM